MLSAIILLEYETRLGENPTSGDRLRAMSEVVTVLGLVRAGSTEEIQAVKCLITDALNSALGDGSTPREQVTGTSLTIEETWTI